MKISLRARILAAFLLSFAAFMAAVGYGLVQMQAIGSGLAVIEVGYLPLARIAAQLDTLQSRIDRDVDYLSGPGGPPAILDLREATVENQRAIEQLLDQGGLIVAEALPLTREPEETAVLTSLGGQLELVARVHREHAEATAIYLGLLEVGADPMAVAMESELASARYLLDTEVDQLSMRIDASILRVAARTAAAQNRALLATATLSSAALIFGVAMLALAGAALRPIGRMTQEVQAIARGDYAARIDVRSRDELGILAEEVNAMARSIQQRNEALEAQAQERLKDQERLARAERLALVGQMLAQITHEVRNPLNAMSLNAELLDEELAHLPPERREEAREILETVTSEIARLEAVTEHYLDLARRPRPAIEPTDPGALVREVSRLLEEELRRAGVALSIEVDEVGEVPADGNQLRRALLNVVRNASEAGARTIAVQLRRAGGEVLIEVIDDGPGMDDETAERALDPFFSTKATGTGLGLAITRQILEDHGGAVRLEPDGGDGTRVTLALPV
jgi:two-component system NtrC family sensor kinase